MQRVTPFETDAPLQTQVFSRDLLGAHRPRLVLRPSVLHWAEPSESSLPPAVEPDSLESRLSSELERASPEGARSESLCASRWPCCGRSGWDFPIASRKRRSSTSPWIEARGSPRVTERTPLRLPSTPESYQQCRLEARSGSAAHRGGWIGRRREGICGTAGAIGTGLLRPRTSKRGHYVVCAGGTESSRLQENPTNLSRRQALHNKRMKPFDKTPQSK